MRVPMNGGTPQPVPGTENVIDFRCGQQPGSRCVLRSTEKGQFVFYELDPLRGRGRELARAAWSPTKLGDCDISPDGRFVAMPNHTLASRIFEGAQTGRYGCVSGSGQPPAGMGNNGRELEAVAHPAAGG